MQRDRDIAAPLKRDVIRVCDTTAGKTGGEAAQLRGFYQRDGGDQTGYRLVGPKPFPGVAS